MRRYKIIACILVILSVFGFVRAAPVAVKEIREARANAVDGGDNVIIGSAKRADFADPEEKEPLLKWWAKQQAPASAYWQSTPWRDGTYPAPNYATGTNPDPSFSSGESKPALWSTSGGTELSWNPEGKAQSIQPGTSTEIQPASSSLAKSKSVSFAPSEKVLLPSGEIPTEIQPASSSLDKSKSVSFAPTKKVLLPWGEISTEMLPSEKKTPQLSITGGAKLTQPGGSTEIQPASSGMLQQGIKPPPGPEGYQPKMAARPTKSKFKKIISKVIGKLKFKP